MSTLIIHPKDQTTTFLEAIYQNLPGKMIVTGGITLEQTKLLVESNDRIIMLGHGSPAGLMAVGQFGHCCNLIVDHSFAGLLRMKKGNIFIWCFAGAFVRMHNLSGFYSGMFISEIEEALYCGLPFVTREMVEESNHNFGHILSENLSNDSSIIYRNVRNQYGILARKNPIAQYNLERLNFNN